MSIPITGQYLGISAPVHYVVRYSSIVGIDYARMFVYHCGDTGRKRTFRYGLYEGIFTMNPYTNNFYDYAMAEHYWKRLRAYALEQLADKPGFEAFIIDCDNNITSSRMGASRFQSVMRWPRLPIDWPERRAFAERVASDDIDIAVKRKTRWYDHCTAPRVGDTIAYRCWIDD